MHPSLHGEEGHVQFSSVASLPGSSPWKDQPARQGSEMLTLGKTASWHQGSPEAETHCTGGDSGSPGGPRHQGLETHPQWEHVQCKFSQEEAGRLGAEMVWEQQGRCLQTLPSEAQVLMAPWCPGGCTGKPPENSARLLQAATATTNRLLTHLSATEQPSQRAAGGLFPPSRKPCKLFKVPSAPDSHLLLPKYRSQRLRRDQEDLPFNPGSQCLREALLFPFDRLKKCD